MSDECPAKDWRNLLMQHSVGDVLPGFGRIEQPADLVAQERQVALLELVLRHCAGINGPVDRKIRLDRLRVDYLALFAVAIHLDDIHDAIGPAAIEEGR